MLRGLIPASTLTSGATLATPWETPGKSLNHTSCFYSVTIYMGMVLFGASKDQQLLFMKVHQKVC